MLNQLVEEVGGTNPNLRLSCRNVLRQNGFSAKTVFPTGLDVTGH